LPKHTVKVPTNANYKFLMVQMKKSGKKFGFYNSILLLLRGNIFRNGFKIEKGFMPFFFCPEQIIFSIRKNG